MMIPRLSGATRLGAGALMLVALAACQAPPPTDLPIATPMPPTAPTATARPSPAARPPAAQVTAATAAPRTPGANRTPPPAAPAPTDRGSDATQSLPLNVPAHAVDIILGRPTDRSVTLSVLAYQDMEGYVQYGTQPGVYTARTPSRLFASGQPAEVIVDALRAGTQYTYRLTYRATGSGPFTSTAESGFATQRAKGSTFTFAVQADSHLDSNTNLDVYARTLANERSDRPDFVIDLGDTFMTGKYSPYTAAQRQYLAQRYFLGLLAPSPLFLVLGNHDGEQAYRAGTAGGDMAVWSAGMRTRYFPNPVPDGFYSGNATPDKLAGSLQDYYAWEWGDALFVVLDPYWFTPQQRGGADNWDRTLGAEQYQWLKRTLETSRAPFKFLFIHQMVGGLDSNGRGGAEAARLYEWGGHNPDGSYGFDANRPGWGTPIHQLLVQNEVSVVFHGHDHLFVRQELDGIVYQAVPQPGATRADSIASAPSYGYVSGDGLGSSGYLRVTASLAQVTVEYVRSYRQENETLAQRNGQVDYSYTIR